MIPVGVDAAANRIALKHATVEHRAQPAGRLPAGGAGPRSQVQTAGPQPDADVAQGLTHFDDLAGSEKELEPGREMNRAATPAVESASARKEPPPAKPAVRVESGSFYVQVGALRDQTAAADLIQNLEDQGYDVRLFSEREGQGILYKVRVGGYPTESKARDMAAKLRESGYEGAWVASVD